MFRFESGHSLQYAIFRLGLGDAPRTGDYAGRLERALDGARETRQGMKLSGFRFLSRRLAAAAGSVVVAALCLGFGAATPAKAADTHPDFTGVWTFHPVPGRRFGAVWPKDAPYTDEAKKKIAAYHALVDPTGESPGGYCVGVGMPGNMLSSGGYPMEVIQRPEQITIIYEAWTEIRRIYIGGEPVAKKDLIPTQNGYSRGHWEGNTLVVETTSLEEQVDQAAAHTENARIVERYTMNTDDKGKKHLKAVMTMTDPEFYTKPVTVTKEWDATSERMLNYNCNEPTWEDHVEMLSKKAAEKAKASGN